MDLTNNDRPLWPILLFYAAMSAAIFSAPSVLDEPGRVVRIAEIPIGWLLISAGVSLIGFAVAFEAYDWSDWTQSERRKFLREFAGAACVCALAFVGTHLLAAWIGWTYGIAGRLTLLPFGVWMLIRYLKRPQREVWE